MSEIKNSSFYDTGQIFKEVHDLHGKTLRVSDSRSVVGQFYTHFRVIYTADNLPSEVSYFRGTQAHRTSIGCISDINRSLQNKHIKIFSAPDNKAFHLWFNVDNLGIAPVITNSTAIEIPINSNDDSLVNAMAITLVLNTLHKNNFYVTRTNSVIEIATTGLGIVTNTSDSETNFAIVNTVGKQELISFIQIGYEGTSPVYKGQLLKNYIFNVFSGQFELKEEININQSQVVWDEISTTFPGENQELYSYMKNSLLVQEVLVTYADSTKKVLTSVQKTRY